MAARRIWFGSDDLRRSLVPLDSLIAHPRNARRGSIPAISDSLERFGQQKAIIVQRSTGHVISGNHLRYAMIELGWTHGAVTYSDLTDEEALAFLAADNRISDLGSYDDDALARLLRDVGDLTATGYDDRDLVALLADMRRRERSGDPDEAPARPAEPKSKPGDLYRLGPHLLICGDAADAHSYEAVLEGGHADMVWTDPPYGVDVVGGSRAMPKDERRARGHREIENDALPPDELHVFLRRTLTMAAAHARAGSNWYVASPSSYLADVFTSVLSELGVRRWTLVWVKDQMVLSRMDYQPRHELIHYGWMPGQGRVRPSDRTLTTVLEYPRPKRSSLHPTMKPVEMIEDAVRHSSRPGDFVLDPFAGSGSTLIACERQGRRAALIELDPSYCDVIRQRYADYVADQQWAP